MLKLIQAREDVLCTEAQLESQFFDASSQGESRGG
jgi:hypothetical protein